MFTVHRKELMWAGRPLVIEAGKAPVIDGVEERRMRVGCGSAAIGIFAKQWFGHADEVIVLDDHITGVLSEQLIDFVATSQRGTCSHTRHGV